MTHTISSHSSTPPAPSRELFASFPTHASADVRAAVARGAFNEALLSAVTSGDLNIAVDVLRVGWFQLIRDDYRLQLRDALDNLSSAELMSHPLLAMALGLAYNADGFRRAKAVYYFGLAATGVRAHPDRISPAQRALVLASESAAFRLMGKSQLSVTSARSALRALEAIHEERAALIGFLPLVYSQLGTSLYYGGQEAEALHVFSRGYAEAGPSDRSSFGNLAMVAGIHALAGNLPEARHYVEMARADMWTDTQRSMYPGTFYRIAEATLALELFDTQQARHHIDAMQHDRRTIEHWTVIARIEALTALLEGNAADALAGIEEFSVLRGAEGSTEVAHQRLASIRSVLHIALGNYDAAARVLRIAAGKTPQDHVDRARLALATDRPSDALKELRSAAGRPQSPRTLAEALSIEAVIGLRAGRGRRTTAVLSQLVAVHRRSGQRIALHLLPQHDFEVLITAIEAAGVSGLRGMGTPLMADIERPALTPREHAILRALTRTTSVSTLAAEMQVSNNTVKTHLKSLYRKLGAKNREEALTHAFHLHLIPTSDAE